MVPLIEAESYDRILVNQNLLAECQYLFFVKEKWRISLFYKQWWVIEIHIEMTHILEESNHEIGTQFKLPELAEKET